MMKNIFACLAIITHINAKEITITGSDFYKTLGITTPNWRTNLVSAPELGTLKTTIKNGNFYHNPINVNKIGINAILNPAAINSNDQDSEDFQYQAPTTITGQPIKGIKGFIFDGIQNTDVIIISGFASNPQTVFIGDFSPEITYKLSVLKIDFTKLTNIKNAQGTIQFKNLSSYIKDSFLTITNESKSPIAFGVGGIILEQ